ncbi:GtrA family protein [Spirillospora sp. NPDC048911]|uniref:GtrA family protein n=1 Tax=Spirillospora sp. NPDC048911 TaxID=3364527 RepID=UPI003715EA03
MSLVANLYRRFAHLVHELMKFGSVGAIAFAITIGLSNALHSDSGLGMGPLSSNAIATVIATTFAYLANRFWTFRHRDRTGLGREYVLFFALNGVGLVITQLFIGFTHYVLDLTGAIAYNAALIVGTGVATLFRFWSYKKWVFLPVTAPHVDPASGLPEADHDTPAPESTAPAPQPVNGHSLQPLGRPIDARQAEDLAEFTQSH